MTERKPEYIGIQVRCTVCNRMKQPHGRSAPYAVIYCNDRCRGYKDEPLPGCLWPSESSSDFGYVHCTNATRVAEQDYTKEELTLIRQARMDLCNQSFQEKNKMRRAGIPNDEANEILEQKYAELYDALTHALPPIRHDPGDAEDWWLSRRADEVMS